MRGESGSGGNNTKKGGGLVLPGGYAFQKKKINSIQFTTFHHTIYSGFRVVKTLSHFVEKIVKCIPREAPGTYQFPLSYKTKHINGITATVFLFFTGSIKRASKKKIKKMDEV